MKQIVQHLSSGTTELVDAPNPRAKSGNLLVDTSVSLISAGTERMLVDFSRSNMLDKARQQPEKVKQVLAKARTDGVMATVDAVRSKLGEPIPLGYSNVGRVRQVGGGVKGFKIGDRIVSNGSHATMVRVPKNLSAKIPDSVSDEAASFTVVGSIGLQGVRLAQPTLGERFVVIGVGLIGLMTVQLLRAQGCRVLAIDVDDTKLALAASYGAEVFNSASADPVSKATAFSGGTGVDGVLITASAKSDLIIKNAAQMCRTRGRIVLVGVVGLNLDRADFYDKELSFQVSCSYGPGRYDPSYEQAGNDYPIGYVRWTEQRNFEAVLELMAQGKLKVDDLITHRFDFDDSKSAYDALSSDGAALGILLDYASVAEPANAVGQTISLKPEPASYSPQDVVVGCIGAGNYASRILIPAFAKTGASLHTLATSAGLSASLHGNNAGFSYATTDSDQMLENGAINTVVVATQHDSHARFSAQALTAGKNVFVEKPLAITRAQLDEVKAAYDDAQVDGASPRLMVGFNRRFAPQIVKMKELLDKVVEPKSFIMTVNAGNIPADHWTQDTEVGGGRIIGEACHFVDLMRHLAGSKIISAQARGMGETSSRTIVEDCCALTLGFEDGSFGTIHYLANGSNRISKERIEVFAAGGVLQLDNFRQMVGHDWPDFRKMNLRSQDKGQEICPVRFVEAVKSGQASPIDVAEIFEAHTVTLDLVEQLRQQA